MQQFLRRFFECDFGPPPPPAEDHLPEFHSAQLIDSLYSESRRERVLIAIDEKGTYELIAQWWDTSDWEQWQEAFWASRSCDVRTDDLEKARELASKELESGKLNGPPANGALKMCRTTSMRGRAYLWMTAVFYAVASLIMRILDFMPKAWDGVFPGLEGWAFWHNLKYLFFLNLVLVLMYWVSQQPYFRRPHWNRRLCIAYYLLVIAVFWAAFDRWATYGHQWFFQWLSFALGCVWLVLGMRMYRLNEWFVDWRKSAIGTTCVCVMLGFATLTLDLILRHNPVRRSSSASLMAFSSAFAFDEVFQKQGKQPTPRNLREQPLVFWKDYYSQPRHSKISPGSYPVWCPFCVMTRENRNHARFEIDEDLDGETDRIVDGWNSYRKFMGIWWNQRATKLSKSTN